MKNVILAVTALLCAWAGPGLAAATPPRVVVSIKPIHSLAAGVMAGIGAPTLLIEGGGSPHNYSLRPSDARALAEAQLIVWVGEGLEGFMTRPLAALGSGAKILTLAETEGVHLLPARTGGTWEPHDDDHEGHGPGAEDDHARQSRDLHLWLDPRNAKAIVRLLAAELGRIDPTNREAYGVNEARLLKRLDALDGELRERLTPVHEVPYVVFHDAYQPLEKRYGLNAVGAITLSPDRRPGARRLREIRDTITGLGARCVFSEPQFEPRLIATVTEGTGARPGTLDPLGAELPAGPEAYFDLMRNLVQNLESCLSADDRSAK